MPWRLSNRRSRGSSCKTRTTWPPIAADYTTLYLTELRLGTLAKYDEAEAIFRSVLAAAERRRDPHLITRAQTDLGYNRLRANRFDEAIPFLDAALATARQCGAKPLIAAAQGNLGACYLHLGDLDRAMETLTHADDLFGKWACAITTSGCWE